MNLEKDIPLTLQAYNALKKRIMELQLRPGELLMIQALSKELGISRTPVREAVVRLEREGFIETAEGKKFKVSPLTMKGVLEIHEIRIMMELYALQNVAMTATKKQISALKTTLKGMKNSLAAKSHVDFFKFDRAFHEKIIQFHGNETLRQLVTQVNDKIQRIRYLTAYIDKRLEVTVEEHRDVIMAIENHDPEMAQKKMAFHLEKVKDGLTVLFEKNSFRFMGGMFIH